MKRFEEIERLFDQLLTESNSTLSKPELQGFDPNEHEDEHKRRVAAAIQRKVQGKQVSLAQAPERSSKANVIDLMAALQASLNAGAKKPSEIKERKGPKRSTPAVARKSAKR